MSCELSQGPQGRAEPQLLDFILISSASAQWLWTDEVTALILHATGLENIKTALIPLFINISSDIWCLQLSAITNRRERVEVMVFQTVVLNADVEMGAMQRHIGILVLCLNFEGGDSCVTGTWQGCISECLPST